MELPEAEVDAIVERALTEDVSHGDVTSELLIPPELQGRASILAKARGILAGGVVARRVFLKVDPSLKVDVLIRDGERVQPGDIVAIISGRVASILKAERTALNFLQHLSGVASETSRYVEAVKGLPVKILDTRKTMPGLRMLEKYAVRMGGGHSHRMDLGGGVLIKDNHLAVLLKQGLSLKEIITKARCGASAQPKVEVEVRTPDEALQATEAGADIVMLDNMDLEAMRRAVELIKGRTLIEASGGITLTNVRAVAETGVDFISVGALTHSVRALDISLELETG